MANIPISSFTAAANATGIGMSGFSLTGANAQSMLDLAGTWNTSGTPTGLKLNVTDTASNAASLLMDLQVGGVSRFNVNKGGQITVPDGSNTAPALRGADADSGVYFAGNNIRFAIDGANLYAFEGGGNVNIRTTGAVRWSSTGDPLGSIDLLLLRDAANTLAQRNSTAAQTLRIYNTFTDASNYERLSLSGNVTSFRIAGEALGTGASRSIIFDTAAGAGGIVFATGGTSRWAVSSSAGAGHFIASTDNTVDIGSNGANRPRDIFSSRDVYAQSNTSGFYLGSVSDVALLRDDANILAQRRSTNAQTFRVYNTSTDASNYERGVFDWINTPNALTIGTQQAGTGTARSMRLITQGDANLLFITNSVTRLDVSSAGLRATANLLWTTDNAFDIGASGATRPRDMFLARNADIRGSIYVGGFGEFLGVSAGVVCIRQFATSDFNRLQFGGATSSFPALKRNGTALETKLADDSAFAPHAMQYLDVTDGITAPGAAAGRARIYVDTADGDLKVVFADGVVKVLATDT